MIALYSLAICAITRPSYAILIGLIGGLTACFSCKILKRLHIDDPVACVPVHLCSGVWSLIAVALFTERDKSGHFSPQYGVVHEGRWKLLGAQVALIIALCMWSAFTTFLLLSIINIFIPIRMSVEDELKGSDECEHGISIPPLSKDNNESSAYGARISMRTDSENEHWRNQGSDSQPSSSNQTTDTANTSNDTIEDQAIVNGGISNNRFYTSNSLAEEASLRITIEEDSQQTTALGNNGYNTSF